MTATNMPLNIEEVLDGIAFPAAKVQLIVYAEDNNASEDAMEMLRALPVQNYNNMQDVNRALGKIERQPGNENQWSSQPNEEYVGRQQ